MTTTPQDFVPALQRNAKHAFAPLQREFNRFFDELGDGFNALTETHFAPSMDVAETKAGLKVTLEVPGLTRDQIQITAEDEVLTVSGEKSETREKTEGAMRLTERSFGRFSRSIYLPRSADGSKIDATMKNGVLTIAIPKRAGVEAKTIEIQSQ
ncbi:MAG: Hsp20/alpha crystallin family protein [Phenylobacterium sp.]|uniref:Hsp20/alpha crystallin family protein n=1 Tax=Phenylobacterium sp. TaxID=1871053 RepID=UPI0012062EBF|nr:Hsp20/alpha crystallin family protein [Phenylobacterium sp.]TAJ69818.1 MAG: Hsp20/alpha crystallin family protein [Phenylobacterium sp.]